jgi:hypothetical protein
MQATELHPIDYDSYRQRAQQLHDEAVRRFIDRAVASAEAALSFRSRKDAPQASVAHPTACRA